MGNIAIIGSGVVGTATGKGMISLGHRVVFHDVKEKAIERLKLEGLDARHMRDLDADGSDFFFFTVSTPTEDGRINLSHLESAVRNVGEELKGRERYFTIVVRSTVPPNTTESMIIPAFEQASGKRVGADFGVAMNPEYLREKTAEEDFAHPRVATVGFFDERSRHSMEGLFEGYPCEVHYVSLREAEMQKYIHNLYNAVKIAFFNEMRTVCREIGIVPDRIFAITTESAEGMWNRGYGTKNLGPFDGMCLPKDTQAFSRWAEQLSVDTDVLNGAIASNKRFKELWEKTESWRNSLGAPVDSLAINSSAYGYMDIRDDR